MIKNSYKKIVIPASELVAKGVTFLIILLLANQLSTDEFGSYNYIVSIVMIISVFLDAGINNYAFDKSLKNETRELSKLFVIKVELSIIICCVSLIFFWVFFQSSFLELFLFTLYIGITSLLFLLKFIARGQGIVKVDLQSILIDPILKLLGVLVLFLAGGLTLQNVFIIYLVSGTVSILYVAFSSKEALPEALNKLYGPKQILKLLIKSKYFIYYYLLMILIQRLDIIYIERYFGFTELGLYSSAFNILLIIQLLCRSTITSRLASIFRSEKKKYKDVIMALFGSIVMVVSLYLLSPYLFKFIFPLEHIGSSGYLQLLLVSIPFYVINLIFVYYNNYIDRVTTNGTVMSIAFLIKLWLLHFLELNSINVFIFQFVGVEIICSALFLFFYFKRKIFKT